jgi:hypothetical protein
MRKEIIGGGISTDDCADFYAAVFGWEVKRWFHFLAYDGLLSVLKELAVAFMPSVVGNNITCQKSPHQSRKS